MALWSVLPGSGRKGSPDRQLTAKTDVARRASDHDAEGARLDDPAHVAVEHAQMLRAESETHLARFSRLQMNALETLQFHHGPSDRRQHVADVQLHDLVAFAVARVLHRAPDGRLPGGRNRAGRDRKRGVLERG